MSSSGAKFLGKDPTLYVDESICRFLEAKKMEGADNLRRLLIRKWHHEVRPSVQKMVEAGSVAAVLAEEHKKLDLDKNGFIDGKELVPALNRAHALVADATVIPAYLKALLRRPTSETDAQAMMRGFDKNSDGRLSGAEFRAYVVWSVYVTVATFWMSEELKAISTGEYREELKAAFGSKPVILTDISKTRFSYPRDVRKEEYWPRDSKEYQAGNRIENRKKPPPPEIEGDVFDRQRVIVGFNQGAIEDQVCFVLGTGGIGQDTALTLARLGVGKIIMLDCDTYDASNLTRQCLGSVQDVGKRKVDAAARGIQAHNIRTKIETVHVDALANWSRVVEIARGCDVIFNGIDVGPMWDFCVSSLAKELGKTYITGQSYDWMFNVEYYTGDPTQLCAWCASSKTPLAWVGQQLGPHFGVGNPRALEYILARVRAFLDEKKAPGLDAKLMVEFLNKDRLTFNMHGPSLPGIVEAVYKSMSISAVPPNATEFERFTQALMMAVARRVLPGQISKERDIAYIPHPKHIATRFVGSWVCPCLAAGVIMVSQFANGITGRGARNPPTNITFRLDDGQTAEEIGYQQTAQMVQSKIFPPDAVKTIADPRTRAKDPSKESCLICKFAKALRAGATPDFDQEICKPASASTDAKQQAAS